ncbi:MAG: MarR family transcriptional regulator [Burkholderiaceae bacterium]|nr:MarR family transcriptional regulator [Burkholderiaceae bacterium]
MKTINTPASFYSAETYTSDESLGWLMQRLKQSIVHMADQSMCKHDLTHNQWGTMFRLHMLGSVTTASLCREMEVDAGAMSRMLDRLEAKGLIVRERSQDDRRVVMVSLSGAGKQLAAELPGVLSHVFNAHLSGFTYEEWRTLINLMQRMLANGEALRACSKEDKDA